MTIRCAIAAIACIVLAACASARQSSLIPPAAATHRSANDAQLASTAISHITVVVMENVAYESIVGNASAPFLNALAAQSALFTNSHALGHPSEPNYLALFSGSTQGITSDACPLTFSGDNIATQLAAQGLTFAGYAEDAPASGNPCFDDPSPVSSGYLYWRKHAPWTDFPNAPNAATQGYTPGVSLNNAVNFIVPNSCNDMHDCSIATGDAWLAKNLPAIESYDAANNGLLILTFDEGQYSADNHIVTLLNGPMVNAGRYDTPIDHYSVFHFIESVFGLPLLGASGDPTPLEAVIGNATPAPPPPSSSPPPSSPPPSSPPPGSPPPAASFSRTGTIGQVFGDYVHVQFGTGCGWLHVFTSDQTVYSPASWRPAPGDTVTVQGTGSCVDRAQATEIDLQQTTQ